MTLLMLDSFDDGMSLLGKWTAVSAGQAYVAGRTGNAMRLATQNSDCLVKTFPAASTLVMGMAYKCDGFGGYTDPSNMRFYSNNGTQSELWWTVLTGGIIGLYRNGTLLASSVSGTLMSGVWTYVEMKATLHDTTGTCIIRVNGVEVINFTGDTKASTFTQFDKASIGANRGVTYSYADDVYLLDGTGTVNNDFLGDITVEALPVNGNGNSSVLVGSDANSVDNYLLVDENPVSTADYVGSATQGNKDTYATGNITGVPGLIVGVQVNSYIAKSDTGLKFSRPIVRSGTTDYVGTSKTLSTDYLARADVWETDPDTAVAWTESGVNAVEVGFEVRDS